VVRPRAYTGTLSVPEAMRSSEVTIPGVELYHYITDDQLTELSAMRAEPVMEVAMGASGAFVGGLVPAIEALSRFQDIAHPMGYVGFFTVILDVVALVVAGLSIWLWRRRRLRHVDLATAIRSRPRVKVTPANDTTSGGPETGQIRAIPPRT
jgi:hypothetical protein